MKKALPAVALGAVAAILALSGCTDSGAAPTSAPTDDAGSGEIRSVRVAALPIAETGALWAAIEEGIFEDHGIEVEVVPAQGGAQAIPALLSGDIQFAIGQPFGPFRADGRTSASSSSAITPTASRKARTSTPSCRSPIRASPAPPISRASASR